MQTEKIVLLDGREIDCWPAVANEELCCEMDDKEMQNHVISLTHFSK